VSQGGKSEGKQKRAKKPGTNSRNCPRRAMEHEKGKKGGVGRVSSPRFQEKKGTFHSKGGENNKGGTHLPGKSDWLKTLNATATTTKNPGGGRRKVGAGGVALLKKDQYQREHL